jgi:hypothetical protein
VNIAVFCEVEKINYFLTMWVTLTLNVARVIPTSDVAGVKILNYNSAGVTILSYYVSVVTILVMLLGYN